LQEKGSEFPARLQSQRKEVNKLVINKDWNEVETIILLTKKGVGR